MISSVLDYRKRMHEKINIQTNKTQKVLDAGCGEGGDTILLSNRVKEIIGVDINAHPNWGKIKKDNVKFQVADICNLPFAEEDFDITFSKEALHHVSEPEEALKEINRVTTVGGTIVIVEANRFNPIFYFHMTLMLEHQHFTRSKFQRIINSVFPEAKFNRFEGRVYLTNNSFIIKLCHKFEDVVENISLFDKFLTYNYAIVKLK
ncbi:MAG: class I SAM-dependent methyltransferase [bacterium]